MIPIRRSQGAASEAPATRSRSHHGCARGRMPPSASRVRLRLRAPSALGDPQARDDARRSHRHPSGESRWITGPDSREFVHRLRDQNDAVMVGSETAIADDPALTVRRDGRVVREPIRLLLDGRLRVPSDARILRGSAAAGTWVLCRARASGIRALREKAGRVLPLPVDASGHVALDAAFAALADEGLTRVLVEGGGMLAAALLRAGSGGRGTLDARAEARRRRRTLGARPARAGCDRGRRPARVATGDPIGR